MNRSGNQRSLQFSKELWDLIEEDAKRCKRSVAQQIEMILSVYFGLNDKEQEVNVVKLIQMRNNSDKLLNHRAERYMKPIEFGKKENKNQELIDEDVIIYQGEALYGEKKH